MTHEESNKTIGDALHKLYSARAIADILTNTRDTAELHEDTMRVLPQAVADLIGEAIELLDIPALA